MKPNETAFHFDYESAESYRQFLAIRRCPIYRFVGGEATVPNEYVGRLGLPQPNDDDGECQPHPKMFDYQRDITRIAVRRRKYAIFADCGLGKTIMLLDFARHCHAATGKRVMIVSPLMVVRQTVEEARHWYGDDLPIVAVKASELPGWLNGGEGPSIGVTNYEAIRDDLPRGELGGLILDECFPGETLIDCVVNGSLVRRRIDNLQPGDSILNASGVDSVVSLKKRKVSYAVVVSAGKKITCSPNHPFFTQRGWVCAQDIEPGDSICTSIEAMRTVRGGVQAESRAGARKVLREILLSEMENDDARACRESSQPNCACQGGEVESCLVCGWERWCEAGASEDHGAQPHVDAGRPGEGFADIAEHEPQTFRAWGQWEGSDFASVDAAGCVGGQMDCGVSVVAGPTTSGISNELQARLGKRRAESKYRGGWSEPLQPEGSGPKAGCEAGFVRVEGVEVLEQGHPELDRFRDADGQLYFYDIEAERHPSFSVGGLLVHNSSMLKSHYGAWGTRLIEMGRGVPWKLCCTGTPAPNDRIEFANHAVFLDRAKTANEFLASYFINRGQTQNRWELKPHAITPFYRDLSDWSIFLTNPATYGWKDNVGVTPPIHIHIETIDLTDEQRSAAQNLTGHLITTNVGGIGDRGKLSQIAKGKNGIATNKPEYIRNMVESWPDESTIIWCHYNNEQESMERLFPDAVSISGATPLAEREADIARFKSGEARILISKPKVLGFGLNLQICTRQVFSGIKDSYEEFYQAVKRSNRIGSTRPLNVHIPVTELEMPFVDNVLRKAGRVESDTIEQEKLFKEIGHVCFR